MSARVSGWSLRRRLALAVTLGVSALWLIGAAGASLILQRETDEVFDGALQEVAERVLPLAYAEVLTRETSDAQRVAPVGKMREQIAYVVRDAKGAVLLQSSDANPDKAPHGLPLGFHSTPSVRAYTEAGVRGTIFVTTYEDLAHRRAAIWASVEALIWPLIALCPLVIIVAWISVSLAFQPVDRFRAALEARGRGNLSRVAADGLPKEVAPIAEAVNALIGRLRDALQAERSFAANSAHELRTPVAAALAQAQRLIVELPESGARERAAAIATALRRLARLCEKLLQLAKAEGAGLIAAPPAPLAPALRLLVREVERDLDLDDEQLRLVIAADAEGVISDLDPDAFAVLARNLIENAVKHGEPEAAVEIGLSAERFEVANGGAPCPTETLAQLTRPFERGATRAGGSGLGLAIAAAICRGAGLRLELHSPRPGAADGFQVSVVFPKLTAS